MTDIPKNTILYNGANLYAVACLRVFAYQSLLAPLRPRKVEVPQRSGAYDYGAKYHDERVLRMDCLIERPIERSRFDELKYVLSRKGRRILLWDQPDRYYVGQCYDAAEVLEDWRKTTATFALEFVCEPYAYALEPTVLSGTGPILHPDYEGTRETPTRITIRNTGNTDLYGITITAREIR